MTDINYYEFSKDVSLEIAKAEDKFGETRWPETTLAEWGLVLGEELGEVQQAIIEQRFGAGTHEAIEKEAIQVAAMAFKVWEAASKALDN
jgi:NTP pyrophosphatase (non-canonical NTP hydrolase)